MRRTQRPLPRLRLHSSRALTLVEVTVSVAVLGLVFATALGTLTVLNKNAVSTRLMTNVREIVQRNIETAVAVPFTSANVPAILALTSSSGVAWDEGIAGNDPVTIYTSRDGTMTMTGTLLRIVAAEPNAVSGDIRRVTFRLNYTLYGRNLSYQLTTIRANDQ
jgi:type II secretory pathway pseudopilin PulG